MKKIISTDLDRTLIPNGKEKYDGSLKIFKEIISRKNFVLIYVTGRSLKLTKKAIKKYSLPLPDYLVSDVGTTIYKPLKGKLIPLSSWEKEIQKKSSNWNVKKIKKSLKDIKEIKLQERKKQNKFKVSFYLKKPFLKNNPEKIINKIKKRVSVFSSRVIYSVDFPKTRGLIDVVPDCSSKKEALEFVIKKLKVLKKDVIFCGDSGNDISILNSNFNSVIVANADKKLKKQIKKKKGIYIAKKQKHLNGNYVSGIIQGMIYFKFISREEFLKFNEEY